MLAIVSATFCYVSHCYIKSLLISGVVCLTGAFFGSLQPSPMLDRNDERDQV